MRRGAELLTFVLLAFGGCEGEPSGPIDVRVDFQVTDSEEVTSFEVDCGPTGEPSAICAEIESAPDVYFPEDGLECPLPVPIVYLTIDGSHGEDELRQVVSPCSEAEDRAIEACRSSSASSRRLSTAETPTPRGTAGCPSGRRSGAGLL